MNDLPEKQGSLFKSCFFLLAIFFLFFLLLQPLGLFSPWVDPNLHTGFYSITQIDPADDSSWYAYLRSMAIDGDIDFFNEKGYRSRNSLTSTGYTHNWPYAFGNSLLWLPYFLLGHFITWVYNILGYFIPMDGFSFTYHALTGIGSATNVLLGIFVLHFILKRFFSTRASLLAITVVCFSSFLPFYMFIRSRMAHANEFLCVVLFLYLALLIYEGKQGKAFYLLAGISAGLLAAVRLNDLPIVMVFICWWTWNFFKDIKAGENNTGQNIQNLVLFLAPIFIIISPVMIISKILHNNYFSLENAKQTADSAQALDSSIAVLTNWFSNFRLIPLLFSADKGLIFSAPGLVAGALGFVVFLRKNRLIGGMFLVGFLINLIQVVTFYSFGVEYGTRYMTPSLPFIAMGLAALIDRFNSRAAFFSFFFLGALLIFWQYLQLIQYKVFWSWNDPLFILKSFQSIPTLFGGMAPYLLRSTSWLNIVFQENFQLNNFVDYFFIIFIPLLQFLVPLATLITGFYLYRFFYSRPTLMNKGINGLTAVTLLFFISLPFIIKVCNPPKTKKEIKLKYEILRVRCIKAGNLEGAENYSREIMKIQKEIDLQ